MAIDFAEYFHREYNLSDWQEIYDSLFKGCKLLKTPVRLDCQNGIIKNSSQIGSADLGDETLLFFDVEVQQNVDLRKNRVSLNNSLARWLAKRNADAAIGVFHSKKEKSYRFTFVRTTHQFNESGEHEEKRTNAKRYTYILGPDRQCRTAIQRFGKLLTQSAVTLDKVEEAFSVEALTKQFYKELFNWYQWAASDEIGVYYPNLDTAPDRKQALQEHLIRLITRLIFVWFIKQKDLVPEELFKPAEVAKRLRNFKPQDMNQDTYYKCYLQNLFFATLNREIGERSFAETDFLKIRAKDYGISALYRHSKEFRCSEKEILDMFAKIPYLNGGLFECLDKKDEEENTQVVYVDGFSRTKKNSARLPNALFFHKEKGIIPLLERYNFTVEENTPLDQTVALDPELLGKVFENLLGTYNPETQKLARKESGSFYTPREIVDYMVEESLIAYLEANSSYEKDLIESLVRDDELPEKIEDDSQTRKELTRLLRSVKILDPACGSGAFPVGALNRIVSVLRKLSGRQFDEYKTKMYLIQNCLYGVDIQNIAVQISKLRFFISLICEQEPDFNDSANNYGVKPLPNLETRFVAADSLIHLTKSQGILNFDEITDMQQELFNIYKSLICPKSRDEKRRLQQKAKKIRLRIKEKFIKFADEADRRNKAALKEKIEDLEEKLLAVASPNMQAVVSRDVQLYMFDDNERQKEIMVDANEPERKRLKAEKGKLEKQLVHLERNTDESTLIAEKIVSWDPFETNKTADYFDPECMFAIKEGFDIVIGNPPYIQLQDKKGRLANSYKDEKFETFTGSGDIYYLFYERGWQLLKENGHLCFITSNTWMRSKYGNVLRKFLANKTNPELLIDLGPKVFASVTVNTNILLFTKTGNNVGKTNSCVAQPGCRADLVVFFKEHAEESSFKTSDSWVILTPIEKSIKQKIEAIGIPLSDWDIQINFGIKTGCNEAFLIDEAIKEKLIADDPKSAEIIHPIVKGKDIGRYSSNWAHRYLIATFPACNYDIEKFPAAKKHLLSFDKERLLAAGYGDIAKNQEQLADYCRQRLEQSGKKVVVKGKEVIINGKVQESRKKTGNQWFETQDQIAYWEDFSKPKIQWKRIGSILRFAFDNKGMLSLDSTCIATGSFIEYLVCVLNSPLGHLLLRDAPRTGTGDLLISVQAVAPLRVPKPSEKDSLFFKEKLSRLLKGFPEEKAINAKIYELYSLDKNEIRYIESLDI